MHRDKTYILPLRTGWVPGPGQPADFPPDLPEDWRLGWFASEHLGVLVPHETWLRVDESELETWREDTPERFRFYLEGVADPGAEPRLAARVLGERFGGLVAEPEALPADWPGAAERWILVPDDEGLVIRLATGARCLARPCPAELVRELREARRWIETLTGVPAHEGPASRTPGSSILLLLGPCRLDDLRRWQQLVELMGLSF